MAQEHTPGPWEYLDIGEIVREDDYDVTIAIINEGAGVSFGEANANASLIAASPDLLDALKGMLRATDFDQAEPWIVAANAAIAKAEGRS